MDDIKIKHLEFIQNIINRMNSNSFFIKGWALTIVAALLALYADREKISYIYVAFLPTIAFWFLDSYYLQMERKFRGLYNDVLVDEIMIKPFNMPIYNYKGCKYCYLKVVFSKTILLVYASIIVLLFILIFLSKGCLL